LKIPEPRPQKLDSRKLYLNKMISQKPTKRKLKTKSLKVSLISQIMKMRAIMLQIHQEVVLILRKTDQFKYNYLLKKIEMKRSNSKSV
jgi:hypothetical protein